MFGGFAQFGRLGCAPAGHASSPPPSGTAFVQGKGGAAVTTTTPTLAWTAAPTSGNLLVLGVSSGSAVTTPAGWALVGTAQVNSNGNYFFSRTATGGAQDTPSYSNTGAFNSAWAMAEFSNVGAFVNVEEALAATQASPVSSVGAANGPANGVKGLQIDPYMGSFPNATSSTGAWGTPSDSFLQATNAFGAIGTATGSAGQNNNLVSIFYRIFTGDGANHVPAVATPNGGTMDELAGWGAVWGAT